MCENYRALSCGEVNAHLYNEGLRYAKLHLAFHVLWEAIVSLELVFNYEVKGFPGLSYSHH